MPKIERGIRLFAILLIFYAIINLLGSFNINDFKAVCKGLPEPVIFFAYFFNIVYSIICIKCGTSIMRHENWARKTAVVLVFISLSLGALLFPIMMRNLKGVYRDSQAFQGMTQEAFVRTTGMFTLCFTFFEIAFIFYFTRGVVKKQFNPDFHDEKSRDK